MRISLRLFSLLALLIAGSASILAQADDPFPDFNYRIYQGNMKLTAQVVQNGQVVTDAIVAVYCGDEIRGKKPVGNGTNPNIVYLTVYGNNKQEPQYLYFKVYANGIIFTYNPESPLTYTFDGGVGSDAEPYIITLPLSLANKAENTETLTTWNGQTCDVVLAGRTLSRDGKWNTLCLPFDLSAEELAGSELAGAEIRTLSSTAFADGTLTLNFTPAAPAEGAVTAIQAGTPYIVRWPTPEETNLANPVFEDVTIKNVTADVETDCVNFVGTFSPTNIFTTEKTNLYLGSDNKLYYPWADGMTSFNINSCRAYFQLKGLTAGDPDIEGGIKAFELNFDEETTFIQHIAAEKSNGVWYDLSGHKVYGKPVQRGIYFSKGRKIFYN